MLSILAHTLTALMVRIEERTVILFLASLGMADIVLITLCLQSSSLCLI